MAWHLTTLQVWNNFKYFCEQVSLDFYSFSHSVCSEHNEVENGKFFCFVFISGLQKVLLKNALQNGF